MRPSGPFARTVAAGLACCATALSAHADPGDIEVTATPTAPLATAAHLAPHAAMQTMLWRQRGALGFGIGVEQRIGGIEGPGAGSGFAGGPGLQPRSDANAIWLGLSLAPSESTRLTWQTAASDVPGTAWSDRPMKVTLSFQRTDTFQHLRRGSLLRMELSGQTTLALRARGGRLGLALTSRW